MSHPVAAVLATPDDPAGELLVADLGSLRSTWFFARDLDLAYPRPGFNVELITGEKAGGRCFRLTAQTLLREVTFDLTRLGDEARPFENLFTMLPGEMKLVECTGCDGIEVGQLLEPGVISFSNEHGGCH